MNRRNFIGKLLAAGAAFSVLPSATTYARNWVKQEALWIPNPAYEIAEYEILWIGEKPRNCVLPIIFQKAADERDLVAEEQEARRQVEIWKRSQVNV